MFSLNICKIFKNAEKEMLSLNHLYVGTEHLFLALLKTSLKVRTYCSQYGVNYDNFKAKLIQLIGIGKKPKEIVLYTPLLKNVIYRALDSASESQNELNEMILLKSIFEEDEGIAIKVLVNLHVDIKELYQNLKLVNENINNKLSIFNLGVNLNENVSLTDIVVGREKELELVIETLIRKNKNNPLLVGDAGVGKTAIIEELARRIKKGLVPSNLKNKVIVNLELASLVAGTKYRGEFEEKFLKIIKEIEENPNIILFVDEIHGIINAGGADGAINASDILKPYLARGQIKIIGATTFNEYNKYILKDKALTRRFEIIKVLEPNKKETITILKKVKNIYERHYNIKITNENIIEIVNLTDKYIVNRKNPDKSLDILDSICASIILQKENTREINLLKKYDFLKQKAVMAKNYEEASLLQEKILKLNNKITSSKRKPAITKQNIIKVICQKNNLPLLEDKIKKINLLKEKLPKIIFGQDNALNKIITVLNNNLDKLNCPISLLLVGPIGVGKTTTVKAIAEILNMNLIQIDLNEFVSENSISRLLGTSAGYVGYDDENILNQILLNPSSIILLEDIDQACATVQNLFCQIIKEGYITNFKGEKINFRNCLIFMTSNKNNSLKIGFEKQITTAQDILNSEFLSLVNEVVIYQKIGKETLAKYLEFLGIKDKEIFTKIDYEKYGLREVKKYVNNY